MEGGVPPTPHLGLRIAYEVPVRNGARRFMRCFTVTTVFVPISVGHHALRSVDFFRMRRATDLGAGGTAPSTPAGEWNQTSPCVGSPLRLTLKTGFDSGATAPYRLVSIPPLNSPSNSRAASTRYSQPVSRERSAPLQPFNLNPAVAKATNRNERRFQGAAQSLL